MPFAGDQPGPADPAVLRALAELYRELAPDVLCLQEVQSQETADALAAALGPVLGREDAAHPAHAAALGPALGVPAVRWRYAPGGRHPQYGVAVFSRWPIDVCPLPESTHAPPLDRV